MRRLAWLGMVFLLVQTVFTAAVSANNRRDFAAALAKNDLQTVRQLLGPAGLSSAERQSAINMALNTLRGESVLSVLRLFSEYGIQPTGYDLFTAVNRGHRDDVIRFLLDGGAQPNGEILLAAAKNQRFAFVREFAGNGVDVDYCYPEEKSYADGMTALLYAAKGRDFETLRLLVDRGADVNHKARDGSTAASLARDAGETAMYNYLLEQGAAEPDPAAMPEKAAQAETPSGQGETAAQPGLGSLVFDGAATFNKGTYRLSGGTAEMRFLGASAAGVASAASSATGSVFYIDRQGRPGSGSFRTEGKTLRITIRGAVYEYQIVTDTSFSGHGEIWHRTGD